MLWRESNNVKEYKINIKKSVIFLCRSNELYKNDFKKEKSTYTIIKKCKILGVNLAKKNVNVQWKL